MKKKKMRRLLARQEMIIANLRNKLSTEIALKLDGRDVYRSTLDQLVLAAVYAGAGREEYDMTTGRRWVAAQLPPGTVNLTVKLR